MPTWSRLWLDIHLDVHLLRRMLWFSWRFSVAEGPMRLLPLVLVSTASTVWPKVLPNKSFKLTSQTYVPFVMPLSKSLLSLRKSFWVAKGFFLLQLICLNVFFLNRRQLGWWCFFFPTENSEAKKFCVCKVSWNCFKTRICQKTRVPNPVLADITCVGFVYQTHFLWHGFVGFVRLQAQWAQVKKSFVLHINTTALNELTIGTLHLTTAENTYYGIPASLGLSEQDGTRMFLLITATIVSNGGVFGSLKNLPKSEGSRHHHPPH